MTRERVAGAGGLVTLWQLRAAELAPVRDGSSDVWSLGVSRAAGVVLAALWLTILIGGLVARHFIEWQVRHPLAVHSGLQDS